jgi:hypothetical protein
MRGPHARAKLGKKIDLDFVMGQVLLFVVRELPVVSLPIEHLPTESSLRILSRMKVVMLARMQCICAQVGAELARN